MKNYKKTYTLSETFVNELIKEPNIKEAFVREGIIKENKLEVGRWYIAESTLVFINDLEKEEYYGFFGARWGIWRFSKGANKDIAVLATPQEVETALISEAKKRGYETGITCLFGNAKDKRVIGKGYFDYISKRNSLSLANDIIFNNGNWAEIVTPTLSIEERLSILEKKYEEKIY